MASKGEFIPRSRIDITDFIGAGHPRPQPRRVAKQKRDMNTPLSSWFQFRLTDVDSLSTFIDHLSAFPDNCFSQDYGETWEIFRSVLGGTQSHFVGDGASFAVNVTTGRQLSDDLTSRHPEMSLKKHQIIATKVPKIEQVLKAGQQSLDGVKEDSLKAVAWESHCLFHPPIRKSENIVELLGLCWESVEAKSTLDTTGLRTIVPALIMEYADEGTWDDLLQSGEVVAFELKMKLGLDVAMGLHTLHQSGLVHCDLKANNVLLFRSAARILTAKVSDFGCATHSFGPEETCLLPPYWPRWDAPEVRPRKSPVTMEDLPKIDVYSFGLLMWQVAFDGKTPFDRKRELSPLFKEVPQFASVISADANGFKEKELAIGVLKDRSDDGMLRGVQASIELFGLQSLQLDKVIQHTLRRDSRQRESMEHLIDDFEEPSDSLKTFPAKLSSPVSYPESSGATISSGKRNLHTTTSAIDIESQDPIYLEDSLPNYSTNDKSRIFYGIHTSSIANNILKLMSYTHAEFLPTKVKEALFHEYGDIALRDITIGDSQAMHITRERKAFSALQYGLCCLLGFGCIEDDDKGLQWIELAAYMGSRQARALTYRLQAARQKKKPRATEIIKDWLGAATAEGSLIAYEDLIAVDSVRAKACRDSYLALNFGPCGGAIQLTKDYILKWHHMQDVKKFESGLLSRIRSGIGQTQSVPIIDEAVDGLGHTLLHYAGALGYAPALTVLLQNGADVNKQPMLGETALGYACRCGYADTALILLKNGANASLRNYYGATVMHYLVYLDSANLDRVANAMIKNKADVNAVSMPVSTRLDFVGEATIYSGTPLHWAVQQNRLDVVRVLLRLGADPLRNELQFTTNLYKVPIVDFSLSKTQPRTSAMDLAAELYRANALQAMVEYTQLSPDAATIPWLHATISTTRLTMMIQNGAAYEERFGQVLALARSAWSRSTTMTDALARGNTTLVRHLLASGYDANTPTMPGFTTLFHALHRGAGISAIILLEHGADPTCSIPDRPACPLTILSFAPEGTHTDEVVQRLIDGGNFYEKEKDSFVSLYDRAVIDGWESTADLLVRHGLPREAEDRNLFKILLRQNSHASLNGLSYLLKHVSASILRYPRVDLRSDDNMLHRLMWVQEDIRDDELNSRILGDLLAVFADPATMNARNRRGLTPAAVAAGMGNYRAIEAFARHGVDLMSGAPSPVDMAAGRIVCPDRFDGDVSTASSRGRKRRRYQENTVCVLAFLLDSFHKKTHDLEEARALVQKSVASWLSREFLDPVLGYCLSGVAGSETSRAEVDVESKEGCMVVDTSTGVRWLPREGERLLITRAIWAAVTTDWESAV